MPKQSVIQIVDAKGGYRVKFVGKNGEPLMNSEVLESVAAVHKNIGASIECGDTTVSSRAVTVEYLHEFYLIEDRTKDQKFVRYGAKPAPAKKVKPKTKK